MSEIKGQLLGLVLVLMVFGVIASAMKAVFNGLKDTVTEAVDDVGNYLPDTHILHY